MCAFNSITIAIEDSEHASRVSTKGAINSRNRESRMYKVVYCVICKNGLVKQRPLQNMSTNLLVTKSEATQ